jgi:hypothetical protein
MQQRTSYEDLLNQLTQNIENFPVDEKTQKRQHEFAPDVKQEIKENFGQLVFPCYAIYRAIGVRPDKSEIKKYTAVGTDPITEKKERRDVTRKRGNYLYFRCIMFFKGDSKGSCEFTNNVARRCNFFVQFFENPSYSFNSPPPNGWGRLRPILFSNPRSAVVDVVQNYEYNIAQPPSGINTILVPNLVAYPTAQTWGNTFTDLIKQVQVPDYEWDFKNVAPPVPLQRKAYRLRPLSNLVTNSGLHLFRIEGAGGKWLTAYKNAILHPSIGSDRQRYVKELQRLSYLSLRAHKIRFDLLTEGKNAKLSQYPPSIRRFRFLEYGSEDVLDTDQSFYPIFPQCTRPNGLLDIKAGKERFAQNNFSYPSVNLTPTFQNMVDQSSRTDRIQSQIVDQEDYKTKPLFETWMAKQRLEDSAHDWMKQGQRMLAQNQYNPNMRNQILPILVSRPIPYGPYRLGYNLVGGPIQGGGGGGQGRGGPFIVPNVIPI